MSRKTIATATNEEARPTRVPKLRFPEFRGEPMWPQGELGEFAVILKGKGIAKADLDPSGSQACIRYGELYTRYGETIREAFSRTSVPASELFLSKPDDVIIPSSGETKIDIAKASCVLAADIALGGDLNVIRSRLNGTFLSYYLNGPKRSDIAKVAQGDTVVHLYPHQLGALRIALPPLAEQQKIAECLCSVDEVIAAQARKVDALKTNKKGLMQQLFPRGGETQPRLRFPEFRGKEEWEKKSLGQVIEIASGQVNPTESPYCDWPQIGSENMEAGTGKLVNVKSAADKGVMSGNYAFDESDILYSKIRPALNKVAAPSFKGICSADIYPIRPANRGLLRSYLLYLLLSQEFLDYAIRNSERGKIPKINRDALRTFDAPIPSTAEQQRIADCLSSLDALITAAIEMLEALKRHKRGLMQQLFPSREEVEA